MKSNKYYFLVFSKDKDWAGIEGINEDLLLTSISMLQKCIENVNIILALPSTLPKISDKCLNYLHSNGIITYSIPEKQWNKRRMFCRMENFYKTLCQSPEGSLHISSECDVMCMKDPFQIFENEFDIGLAKRNVSAKCVINGGLVFIRNSQKVRDFYSWGLQAILNNSWDAYVKAKHKKCTLDVYCDLAFLLAMHNDKQNLKEKFQLDIKLFIAGYCSSRETEIEYNKKRMISFHLKAMSKNLIYEKWFTDLIRVSDL